jgi:radical SAM superfamily enzyme YgiQ (UPF0313 family)
MNKNITNEEIVNTARSLKLNGIHLFTYNMLDLPGETVREALDTYSRISFFTLYSNRIMLMQECASIKQRIFPLFEWAFTSVPI